MALTIPKEQKHGVDVPAMMAFYQYVKLSPMGAKQEYGLTSTAYSEELKWELSGDNIINLAKSYIQYDIEIETNGVQKTAFTDGTNAIPTTAANILLYPKTVKGMKEGFGIAAFRICNQTGTDLVKLDDSYEPYRVFMDELVRKRPDIFYQSNFYDGIQLKWSDEYHDSLIQEVNEWEMPKDGDTKIKCVVADTEKGSAQQYKNKLVIHVKLFLGKLYNTFASMKSDIFFGERMYICLRFQTLPNFGDIKAYYTDDIGNNCRCNINGDALAKLKLKNFMFYAYLNKDTQCNNNTRSYCLSKPIQFNDVKCHQIANPAGGSGIFNYSFTLNSSNGPFLRYIIYRPWIQGEQTGVLTKTKTANRYAVIPSNAQFRWMINDFVYQPDYSNMETYDSYMTVKDYFTDSWFDIFKRDKPWEKKFFEILNFGSKDLDNIKNQSGRPLATDLKITFEFSTPGTNDFTDYEITHRFYIVTGRMCTINGSGIVSVI